MNTQQLLDAICSLSLKQCAELNAALAETLNLGHLTVSSTSQREVVAPNPPPNDAEVDCTVTLESFGSNKIQVISAVRQALGLGLGPAKALVESAPTAVKESVPKQEALELKARLEAAGAVVSLR